MRGRPRRPLRPSRRRYGPAGDSTLEPAGRIKGIREPRQADSYLRHAFPALSARRRGLSAIQLIKADGPPPRPGDVPNRSTELRSVRTVARRCNQENTTKRESSPTFGRPPPLQKSSRPLDQGEYETRRASGEVEYSLTLPPAGRQRQSRFRAAPMKRRPSLTISEAGKPCAERLLPFSSPRSGPPQYRRPSHHARGAAVRRSSASNRPTAPSRVPAPVSRRASPLPGGPPPPHPH